MTDPDGLTALGSITVSVTPVNDPPTAVDDGVAWIVPGMSYTFDALANDFDIDTEYGAEAVLTVISVTQGSYGTVTFTATSVTYTADANFFGSTTDYFTYTMQDQDGETSTAMAGASYSGSALLAMFSRPRGVVTAGQSVNADDEGFQLVVAEARNRWEQAGVNTSTLDGVEIQVADLGGMALAVAMDSTIIINSNAAGFGWFVDATPGDEQEFHRASIDEFHAKRRSDAYARMDLLTVVMHEMGHVLGFEHEDDGLMDNHLAAGVRRTPDDLAMMLALGQSPGPKRKIIESVFSM